MRVLVATGKNVKLVDTSFHTASSKGTRPAITSRTPCSAFGASFRDNEGLRRSQSTKMTRAPACAISTARLAEIVDFPSLGSDEVKPTIAQRSRSRFAMELALAAPYKGLPSLLTAFLPELGAPLF